MENGEAGGEFGAVSRLTGLWFGPYMILGRGWGRSWCRWDQRWGDLAAAAVGEDKYARAGAALVNGHGGSPEKVNFGFIGKPARERSRALLCVGEVWQVGMELSSRMMVKGFLEPGKILRLTYNAIRHMLHG